MFNIAKKEELINYLKGLKFKRRNKSDGEIYDFMELLICSPVQKDNYQFKNPELIKRVRTFFVNHDFPFTVRSNETEWYLDMRNIKDGR